MPLNGHFIKQVIPSADVVGPQERELFFCLDSRTIKPQETFVALQGQQVDGHLFIKDAVQRGAQALMIMKSRQDALNVLSREQQKSLLIIMVEDTLEALIELARAWRAQFSIPLIGITGSVGKTSTKELLHEILRAAGKNTLASHGNQNTVLGVCLTLLRLRPEHECALFEMGVSKRGEMGRMASIVQPTAALITMIGHSHMEGLGSLHDIASEKRDIFKYFKADNIGIINGDQPILSHIAYHHPIIRFGHKTINQIQARKIQITDHNISLVLKIYNKKYPIILQTPHEGRIMHALAAASIAQLLMIDHATIISVLEKRLIVARRFEERALRGKQGIVYDDCYNASPESMKAAIATFDRLATDQEQPKIAVLGDMLELGVNSQFWHRQLGRFLRKSPSITRVIFVGEYSKSALKTMPLQVQVQVVPSWREAQQLLEQEYLDKKPLILVKGSRGMQLDQLVNNLCE